MTGRKSIPGGGRTGAFLRERSGSGDELAKTHRGAETSLGRRSGRPAEQTQDLLQIPAVPFRHRGRELPEIEDASAFEDSRAVPRGARRLAQPAEVALPVREEAREDARRIGRAGPVACRGGRLGQQRSALGEKELDPAAPRFPLAEGEALQVPQEVAPGRCGTCPAGSARQELLEESRSRLQGQERPFEVPPFHPCRRHSRISPTLKIRGGSEKVLQERGAFRTRANTPRAAAETRARTASTSKATRGPLRLHSTPKRIEAGSAAMPTAM